MVIKIKGMKCNHCVSRVENALKSAGATNLSVNLDKGEAVLEGLEQTTAVNVIKDLGFKAKVTN